MFNYIIWELRHNLYRGEKVRASRANSRLHRRRGKKFSQSCNYLSRASRQKASRQRRIWIRSWLNNDGNLKKKLIPIKSATNRHSHTWIWSCNCLLLPRRALKAVQSNYCVKRQLPWSSKLYHLHKNIQIYNALIFRHTCFQIKKISDRFQKSVYFNKLT